MRNGQKAAMFEAFGHHLQSRSPNRDEHLRRQIDEILSAIDPPMLMARLEYAARGWPTFPAPADGSKKSKKSAEYSNGKNWGMSTDERTIRRDFKKWPDQNIGIVTGLESGIFVVETDTTEHGDDINGEATLHTWENQHGVLPDTLKARSPSGSIHRFFNHPGLSIKIKNIAGVLPGVDVRGDGGMVLAAPSYRPPRPKTDDEPAKAGGVYVWVNEGHPIADAPQALLDLVSEKAPPQEKPINEKAQNFERQGQRTSSNNKRTRSWAEAALEDERDKLASTPKTKRNEQLNKSAFSLGQIVGAGLLSEADVIEALMQAAEENGLLKDDGKATCTKTINSGLSDGKLKPRDPPETSTPDDDGDTAAPTPEAEAIKATKATTNTKPKTVGVTIDDFYALMPSHSYIFAPSRELWPGSSVDSRIDPIPVKTGSKKKMKASKWLDQNQPVEQMTWGPGYPTIIEDRLISDGGWIERDGVSIFNMYRPPTIKLGDAKQATKWIDLVKKVYPNDAEEIFNFCAHRRQHPEDKINHALILGGAPGIGKDTILEGLKQAVGPWNFREVSPQDVMGPHNDFIKSVALRISEVRDLGDVNRYAFYEHTKTITAAPPDVIRINTKYIPQHYVLNICGVIYTTNYKTNGIYLPPDDRRHYVAWSDLTQKDFKEGFWAEFWNWYLKQNGFAHVAAWLQERDISKFDSKTPPEKTPAFWAIVDANAAPEESELADILDEMGKKPRGGISPINATTLAIVTGYARGDFQTWLMDRNNRRKIPFRFEKCGFVPVRSTSKDGSWVVSGTRQTVYARAEFSLKEQIRAAQKLADDNR